MAYVIPLTMALSEPTSIFNPSATTVERVGTACPVGIATVVLANPMPSAPMRIVCPSRTVVIGGSPGDSKYVEDPIMAAEGPIERVMLPTVTAESLGGVVAIAIGTVVSGATTRDGSTVNDSPWYTTTCEGAVIAIVALGAMNSEGFTDIFCPL